MNRTILMLEHDEDDRYITNAVFQEKGYAVDLKFVSNPEELKSCLHTSKRGDAPMPSLILLNYQTFPVHALDVLKDLKSDPACSHIPVIVLSGTVRPEIIRQCYLAGASSFVQKPWRSDETDTKIDNFFRYWFQTVELA